MELEGRVGRFLGGKEVTSASRQKESVRNEYRQESRCHVWGISGLIVSGQRAREMRAGVVEEAEKENVN